MDTLPLSSSGFMSISSIFTGESIGDSISLRLDSNPGKRMLSRMMQQIRIQSASLILDPALNSEENILTNIYQIFCFVAVKFNYHVINLPKGMCVEIVYCWFYYL